MCCEERLVCAQDKHHTKKLISIFQSLDVYVFGFRRKLGKPRKNYDNFLTEFYLNLPRKCESKFFNSANCLGKLIRFEVIRDKQTIYFILRQIQLHHELGAECNFIVFQDKKVVEVCMLCSTAVVLLPLIVIPPKDGWTWKDFLPLLLGVAVENERKIITLEVFSPRSFSVDYMKLSSREGRKERRKFFRNPASRQ